MRSLIVDIHEADHRRYHRPNMEVVAVDSACKWEVVILKHALETSMKNLFASITAVENL